MSLKKKLLILLLILISFFPILYGTFTMVEGLRKLELNLIDLRYTLRGEQPPWQQITIVEIDTATLDKLHKWPLPRTYYADLVKVLNKNGAKVIGFDILFDADSGISAEHDIYFSNTLRENNNIVLASRWVIQEREDFRSVSWSIPIKQYRKYADYGFVNQVVDTDGSVRKSFLASPYSSKPSFSWDLKVLAKFLEKPPDSLKFNKEQKTVFLDEKKIPLSSSNGDMYINYIGKKRSFPHIPFYQVLENRIIRPELIKDKIILIGATDAILHDFFNTPFGDISGVEVHANAIHTIMRNAYLATQSRILGILISLLVVGLITFFSLKTRAIFGLLLTVFIIITYSVYVILAFNKFNLFVPWVYPIFFGTVFYFGVVFIRFIKEEQQKRQIKGAFKQYVSPSVVEELLRDPSKLKLGGEKRELTVFFSDVRSFTTYSENHTPEQVVEILNEYLDAMTKTIFKWQGTLDKYVGDEIMAIWGAPLPQENHAELALKCCWEQLYVLRELQKKWTEEGRQILDIGMGLNTGEMITGNIGSTMHKDYTVIGDAVNLGARLEAETRHYGTPEKLCYLIISEFTYELVKDLCEVKPLGAVKVKGKNKPVDIYEVLRVKDMPEIPEMPKQ